MTTFTRVISTLKHSVQIIYNGQILQLPAEGTINNLTGSLIQIPLPTGVVSQTYEATSGDPTTPVTPTTGLTVEQSIMNSIIYS